MSTLGRAEAITAVATVLNLALYTAYDKTTKSLAAAGLLDVLLVRRGLDHTLASSKLNI
jgi:hypothetical protein